MAIAEKPGQTSDDGLDNVKRRAAAKLTNFDEEALRNSLIQAAGNGLLVVAESSEQTMKEQSEVIRRSASYVDDIFQRISEVIDRVQVMDTVVDSVASGTQEGARELQKVNAKIQTLEQHVSSIHALIDTVNHFADQAKLLTADTSIATAPAPDMDQGHCRVANEIQRLSETTKQANREIKDALVRISQAIGDLSQGVSQSVRKMDRSIESLNVARRDVGDVEAEAARFNQRLQDSVQLLRELADSSTEVENGVQEVSTIGSTFAYLLEMMAMQGAFREAFDPLARLFPLVRGSAFYDPHRFSAKEDEYVLTEQDILISATDPAGVITFANNRFYEVAEYPPGELIGKDHNIIRHPDMPKTAFADLWAVIKVGKTWQGYVKNRSKTGRGYWLKAHVFPCFENGRIVGYISIRTKPYREKVRQAIEVYRRVP